jgi:hypothetical protein
MNEKLLLTMLQEQLTLNKQRLKECEQILTETSAKADIYRSLVKSIETTIAGVRFFRANQTDLENEQNDLQDSPVELSKDYAVSLEKSLSTPFFDESSPNPKSMKLYEFRNLGYLKIAEILLRKNPQGLDIEALTELIFDTEKFGLNAIEKAKNSLSTELNRGVREERLCKDEAKGIYFLKSVLEDVKGDVIYSQNTTISSKSNV